MNLQQTKLYLEKIIALYKSMSADEQNISVIERDLMRTYIRKLYETCLENTAISQTPAAPPKPQIVPKTAPNPPVEPPQVVASPTIETPPMAPIIEASKAPLPPPPRAETPVFNPQPPASEPDRPRPTPSVSDHFSSDIEALFEEISSKELSDRLANTPIADLAKALSLNDRLLMQNELFGGNKTTFDEALKDLNNASSFDTARAFLGDLAQRNQWTGTRERQKHAKAFIKLVRRRLK